MDWPKRGTEGGERTPGVGVLVLVCAHETTRGTLRRAWGHVPSLSRSPKGTFVPSPATQPHPKQGRTGRAPHEEVDGERGQQEEDGGEGEEEGDPEEEERGPGEHGGEAEEGEEEGEEDGEQGRGRDVLGPGGRVGRGGGPRREAGGHGGGGGGGGGGIGGARLGGRLLAGLHA